MIEVGTSLRVKKEFYFFSPGTQITSEHWISDTVYKFLFQVTFETTFFDQNISKSVLKANILKRIKELSTP